MRMARRRYRKNEGLLELAMRSDWRFGAILSAVCVTGAAIVIPGLFSANRLLAFATEGDWTTPTCPSCGAKMVDRDSKRGRFWGCSNFPNCKATLGMRGQRAALAA